MFKFPCVKCNGTGFIKAFSGIKGGVCFTCKGTAFVVRKTAPKPSKRYVVSFLWDKPEDVNYINGGFCSCYSVKSSSKKAVEKKAAERMEKNGSIAFLVTEVV